VLFDEMGNWLANDGGWTEAEIDESSISGTVGSHFGEHRDDEARNMHARGNAMTSRFDRDDLMPSIYMSRHEVGARTRSYTYLIWLCLHPTRAIWTTPWQELVAAKQTIASGGNQTMLLKTSKHAQQAQIPTF
jgi:hypothetical protein